jgi:hypothetical protein
MSKRVYEIAQELDLSTKEVIGRLNEAGVEVKSHFAAVEDSIYERVFGDDSDSAAPNGRSEEQEAEILWSEPQPPRKPSAIRALLPYILVAALALALAAGVGVMAALIMQGDLSLPGGEASRSPGERENAPRAQQENAAGEPKQEAASRQSEAEYVGKVGDIQSNAVETFLDSHDKLLRYDALTADDVEEMQADHTALQGLTYQVDDLDPPRKYREQHEVFRAAISELHEAAQLAHTLAADPAAATQSGFEEYDRHVNEAAVRLERSNEILGRNYKTIEGVPGVSHM